MTVRGLVALGALVLTAGGATVHPFGPVNRNNRAMLLAGAQIDAANLGRLRQSCANCHSESVRWPWYSYVPPTSWLIERDVIQARSHMNLSRWPEYTSQERITLLSAIGPVLKAKAMPPRRYTLLHPEARLSEAERSELYEWTRGERRRLEALPPESDVQNQRGIGRER